MQLAPLRISQCGRGGGGLTSLVGARAVDVESVLCFSWLSLQNSLVKLDACACKNCSQATGACSCLQSEEFLLGTVARRPCFSKETAGSGCAGTTVGGLVVHGCDRGCHLSNLRQRVMAVLVYCRNSKDLGKYVMGAYCALCPRCACAVHKVCTGPCPTCIVVPSTRNNEPCSAFMLHVLHACFALISGVLV